MNAAILPFRTDVSLPATAELGNPDHVTVLSDFENAAEAEILTSMVVEKVTHAEGPVTAQAAARLATKSANILSIDEDGVASIQLRSVASVRRPSGRVGGVCLVHTSVQAEHTLTPEGSYIVLRVGAPVVHIAALGEQVPVMEATLQHMLDQIEEAAATLADALGRCDEDTITWNLPTRSTSAEFQRELNMRFIEYFYARPNRMELPLAA